MFEFTAACFVTVCRFGLLACWVGFWCCARLVWLVWIGLAVWVWFGLSFVLTLCFGCYFFLVCVRVVAVAWC